jgi:hypothetical protein
MNLCKYSTSQQEQVSTGYGLVCHVLNTAAFENTVEVIISLSVDTDLLTNAELF